MDSAPLVEAALAYARRGWKVFPCRRNKKPFTSHGFRDASSDLERIIAWWDDWPGASIGIATGAPSNLVVVDIDPTHGGDESLETLRAQYGALPDTPGAFTGGGGYHLYLLHPGYIVPCSVSQVGPGIDIRADGGYVIAPPSPHLSGKLYEWELSSHPDDVPLASIPEWLMALIRSPKKPHGREIPTEIQENHRNNTLFKIAAALRARGLQEHAIYAACASINTEQCKPPLDEKEVRSIAKSVTKYPPGEISPSEVLAGAPSSDNGLHDEFNPVIQEMLAQLFGGLEVRRIIQQGVSDAHFSIEFDSGLVSIGSAKQFLEQQTWRALLLSHGKPPFKRQKEDDWHKTILRLQGLVQIEDSDIGTREWMIDVLNQYRFHHAIQWTSDGKQDTEILQSTKPFLRETRLHVHSGNLTQWMALQRLGNLPRPAVLAALRALDFRREQITASDEGKVTKRHYWCGYLDE